MMKRLHLFSIMIMALMSLTFGLVSAQDATQEASSDIRPALLPCVEGAKVPCVDNVNAITPIVGIWRSYVRDMSGVHFGFTVYKEDGSIGVTVDPAAEPTIVGNISFADGFATITANTSNLAMTNCVGAGSYVIREIRFGDEPVALTYYLTTQPDVCFGGIAGYTQPMLYYPGTGKDLTELDPAVHALAQPLIPCLSLPRPCDMIATKLDDIKGTWKSYFSPVPGGVAFGHNTDTGSNMMVGNGDNLSTLKNFFPAMNPIAFDGALFHDGPTNATDPCASDTNFVRIIKFGDQRVALLETPVQDLCVPRKFDWGGTALIWVSND